MIKNPEDIKEFLKNIKLEIVIVIVYIVLYIIKNKCHLLELINLQSYFTQDRLNGVATFFAITIATYIAVVTILATTEIGISKRMLEQRLDKPLINVIMFGVIENFIAVALSIFMPSSEVVYELIALFIILSLCSFVKFIILLITIFKVNMNEMAKSIDDKEKYENDLIAELKKISMYCKKNNENYLNKRDTNYAGVFYYARKELIVWH